MGGSPPIIVMSDQNFLPTLSGGGIAASELSDWRTAHWKKL
jgi:hypothetical protein